VTPDFCGNSCIFALAIEATEHENIAGFQSVLYKVHHIAKDLKSQKGPAPKASGENRIMNEPQRYLDNRKLLGAFVAAVILIGVLGMVVIFDDTPTTYHYEERLSNGETRSTRFTISGVHDANITVSFIDEPGLWYRVDITHYTSVKHHAVQAVRKPAILPLRVHLTSVTPVKSINIVLGVDVVHSLYISGENLDTIVTVDNGAKISGSRCRFHSTGVFKFVLRENVNFTSTGMDLIVGDGFLLPEPTELVVLDIDLPPGMNGLLRTQNTSFFRNEWPIKYDDQWGTTSIDEPLLDIRIFFSMRVWANLMI
jgi:hypothetical protein